MNSIQKALIAAKAVIADPAKWIKGRYGIAAKDAISMGHGRKAPSYVEHIPGYQPEAVCFCAVGAMQKVVGPNGNWGTPTEYLDKAAKVLSSNKYDYAPYFNDALTTTHEDVMAMFDKAIELAGEKQS